MKLFTFPHNRIVQRAEGGHIGDAEINLLLPRRIA
jgi:hypothetical protein